MPYQNGKPKLRENLSRRSEEENQSTLLLQEPLITDGIGANLSPIIAKNNKSFLKQGVDQSNQV
jgi:hypothetical protein